MEEKTNSTALIPEEYWLDLFREIPTGSVGRKRFYWIWLLFELLYYSVFTVFLIDYRGSYLSYRGGYDILTPFLIILFGYFRSVFLWLKLRKVFLPHFIVTGLQGISCLFVLLWPLENGRFPLFEPELGHIRHDIEEFFSGCIKQYIVSLIFALLTSISLWMITKAKGWHPSALAKKVMRWGLLIAASIVLIGISLCFLYLLVIFVFFISC
jgi:hypothetical protein